LAGAQPVQSTPWHRDDSLETYSVRVSTGDDEITLSVNDWGDRLEEVQPFLREWIRQRVHIERTKLKVSSRRRDPYWTDQWRRAHPWGVSDHRAAKASARLAWRAPPRPGVG